MSTRDQDWPRYIKTNIIDIIDYSLYFTKVQRILRSSLLLWLFTLFGFKADSVFKNTRFLQRFAEIVQGFHRLETIAIPIRNTIAEIPAKAISRLGNYAIMGVRFSQKR